MTEQEKFEANFPYLPSEVLEPHLTRFYGLLIQFIGREIRFPSKQKWKSWSDMMQGVSYIVGGNRPRELDNSIGIHASLAYSNFRRDFDPYWPGKEFDLEKAKTVYENCKKARNK